LFAVIHLARDKIIILGIVAAFIALGTWYSFTTPLFESPDEVWHYAYVREIATRHSFPVMRADGAQPWAQEGTQAPLYYLLGAPLIAWIDPNDLAELPAPNPFVRIGEPQAATNDNRNAFLHTVDEAFPFRNTALAVHLVRLYSVILGALTIVLTYALALQVFPEQPLIANAAAAFVAFLPQFVFIGSSINNDNLATPFSTAMLWQLAVTLRRGITVKRATILGILAGGALLSKFNTVTLVPLALLVIFVVALPKRAWRTAFSCAVVMVLVTGLIAGWWYARSYWLYGDATGLSLIINMIGERPVSIDMVRWFIAENEGLRLSTWGVFGWMNILATPAFYSFFDWLALVGLAGIVVAVFSLRDAIIDRAKRSETFLPALLALWCAITFAALVRYNLSLPAAQGRLLFPALAAFAVLWAWGITSIAPTRFKSWVIALVASAQFTVAAIVPMAFIAPAYTPTMVSGNLPSGTTPLNYKFNNDFEWVGSAMDQSAIQPGESLNVTLAYKIPGATNRNIATFIHVVNSAEVIIAQRDSLIGAGNPNALPASGIAADTYRIDLPITANAPDEYRIVAGIYDPATNMRFKTSSPPSSDALTLATVRAEPSSKSWDFDFDGRAKLVGADSSATKIARGDTLVITLHWSHGLASHHVFVHALDNTEQTWASAEVPLERETRLELKFDAQTPFAVYWLELGVYPTNGDRVPVFDSHHQLVGDRIFLNPIRVIDH